MKAIVSSLFFLSFLVVQLPAKAETFSSFQVDKLYRGDGRWIKNGKTFLFRINEGSGNEEFIVFAKNELNLASNVKYKLCFKITEKNCHLNCKAEALKNVALLSPWEDAEVWIPSPLGDYSISSEKACQ